MAMSSLSNNLIVDTNIITIRKGGVKPPFYYTLSLPGENPSGIVSSL